MTTLTASRSAVRLDDAEPITLCGEEAHSMLASIDGVLELLEKPSETSENTFNAFCLLCLVRGQLEGVMRSGGDRQAFTPA